MRRPRLGFVEDVLFAQVMPGFLLAVAWTVLYEVFHEEGSYYTTLMQEILEEGLFPYFLVSAMLMAFPVGFVVDSVRHVVAESRFGRHRLHRNGPAMSPLQWIERMESIPEDFEQRHRLYREAWSTVLIPAKAAGNLAVVLLILTIWSLVKIIRMGGWSVFSPIFVIGTPLVGLALVAALFFRYARGTAEFHRQVRDIIFPTKDACGSAGTEPFVPSSTP